MGEGRVSQQPRPLNIGKATTAPASGTARVALGPVNGPPNWDVTRIVVRTSTPGVPPIPLCSVYLDTEDANGLQDQTYDGSFDQSDCKIKVFKGSTLIAVWTGAAPGAILTMSLSGEQVYT